MRERASANVGADASTPSSVRCTVSESVRPPWPRLSGMTSLVCEKVMTNSPPTSRPAPTLCCGFLGADAAALAATTAGEPASAPCSPWVTTSSARRDMSPGASAKGDDAPPPPPPPPLRMDASSPSSSSAPPPPAATEPASSSIAACPAASASPPPPPSKSSSSSAAPSSAATSALTARLDSLMCAERICRRSARPWLRVRPVTAAYAPLPPSPNLVVRVAAVKTVAASSSGAPAGPSAASSAAAAGAGRSTAATNSCRPSTAHSVAGYALAAGPASSAAMAGHSGAKRVYRPPSMQCSSAATWPGGRRRDSSAGPNAVMPLMRARSVMSVTGSASSRSSCASTGDGPS